MTFLELTVDRAAAPRSPIATGRVPGNVWVYNGEAPQGTLIVWVQGGYLSALEYGWVTDDQPTDLPSPIQVEAR